MAGGGSIPFESLLYGFTTLANELNPVASVILSATLDYPARFGLELAEEISRWGKAFAHRVQERLDKYFPCELGENVFAYLWARTVSCPLTGKPVPLSPNWWLQKGSHSAAVRLKTDPSWQECRFEILHGSAAEQANPDLGTIRRGVAVSPWTGEVIDGDYIKREAQAGRLGQQLYAIGVQSDAGKRFRLPTIADLNAVREAEWEMKRLLQSWQVLDLVPNEEIPEGNKTSEPLRYGMTHWHLMFSPRQLLALGTYTQVMQDLRREIEQDLPQEKARAVVTYLALALDKAIDRNSYLATWIPQRGAIAHTFVRHDLSMKWSFAEFDAAHSLVPWVVGQIQTVYKEMVRQVTPARLPLWERDLSAPVQRLKITQGSAHYLESIPSNSVHLICVDPPYYDNVSYSELSDYFYVWLKRTIGDLYPGWFQTHLTDKEEEAVANPARFASFGSKRRQLAQGDYERKMGAAFREMHRVLRPDGVLTVMFTHKQVEAWDTLATALIGAGFRIQASWPIHTEFEHSLNQAKKNAAESTILLACRKRQQASEPVWWEDLKAEVRRAARERAAEFAEQGISGVDLYISAFGPALAVISEHWPVLTSDVDAKTGKPKTLRPEVALDLAREEVIGLRKQGLLLGRQVQFDPLTDWYLMAWDAFKAEEFPADEARKLAIAVGLDNTDEIVRHRLVAKKQSTVVLQKPLARRRNDVVDPDAVTFRIWIDAAHTAMLAYEEDGSLACEQFLKRQGYLTDGTFKALLQAMINAIPRTKIKGKFVRPEAETLDKMRLAFFEDLVVPAEEAPPELPKQKTYLSDDGEVEGLEGAEDEEGEE